MLADLQLIRSGITLNSYIKSVNTIQVMLKIVENLIIKQIMNKKEYMLSFNTKINDEIKPL